MSEQNRWDLADDFCKCVFLKENICILIQVSWRFVSKDRIDSTSALVQFMAWCGTGRHAVIWTNSLTYKRIDQRASMRPRQNGRLFANGTFKRIFLNQNIRISTKNSLKFVPTGLINNIPALVLIMAWRRPGDKPLSEPMLVKSLTHICVTRPQWVKEVFPKCPIENKSTLVQVMAWCWTSDNPLPEPMKSHASRLVHHE